MEDPISIITRRASQYATLPTLSGYQTESAGELDANEIGDNYNLAVALLMLHKITMDNEKDYAGGQVTGAAAGRVSRQWRASRSSNDDWSTTRWGRELEQLLNRSIATNGSGLSY